MDSISIDVRKLALKLKSTPHIKTQDLFEEAESALGSFVHEWHAINDSIILHIADFTTRDAFKMINIRPGYICFEIAFRDTYLRSIEDVQSLGEVRTVQISGSNRIEYDVEAGKSSRGIIIFCEQAAFMRTFEVDIARIQKRGRSIFLNSHGSLETLRVPLFSKIAEDIDEIINVEYKSPLKSIFLGSKVVQILCSLVDHINEYGAGPRLLLPQGFRTQIIEAAARIYKNELRNPPSLEDLANRIGVDRRELTKGFQELFGTTPRGFQLQQRMEHAEVLLQEGGKSISEIGRIVGYQGYRTFVRAYQTFHGKPPATKSRREIKGSRSSAAAGSSS